MGKVLKVPFYIDKVVKEVTVPEYISLYYSHSKYRIIVDVNIFKLIEKEELFETLPPKYRKTGVIDLERKWIEAYHGKVGVNVLKFGQGWFRTKKFLSEEELKARLPEKVKEVLNQVRMQARKVSELIMKEL